MNLFQCIQDLSLSLKKPATGETLEQMRATWRFAKIEVGKAAMWRHLLVPNTELIIEADYDEGTIAVTANSRTVTLTGGSVLAKHKGWYLQASSSTRQYEVRNIDTVNNQ